MSDSPQTTAEHLGFRHPQSAIRAPMAHVTLWLCAALGLTADLWTKAWAFRTLDAADARKFIPGVLEFQLSLNAGALFGMGSGMGTLFIFATLAALAFVIYLFAGTSRRQTMVHVALAFILAGALGNLHDRAFERYELVRFNDSPRVLIGHMVSDTDDDEIAIRPWFNPDRVIRHSRDEVAGEVEEVGVVRDFLHFVPTMGERALWPWIFNIADVLLVVGVGLLLIGYWRQARAVTPAVHESEERLDPEVASGV